MTGVFYDGLFGLRLLQNYPVAVTSHLGRLEINIWARIVSERMRGFFKVGRRNWVFIAGRKLGNTRCHQLWITVDYSCIQQSRFQIFVIDLTWLSGNSNWWWFTIFKTSIETKLGLQISKSLWNGSYCQKKQEILIENNVMTCNLSRTQKKFFIKLWTSNIFSFYWFIQCDTEDIFEAHFMTSYKFHFRILQFDTITLCNSLIVSSKGHLIKTYLPYLKGE